MNVLLCGIAGHMGREVLASSLDPSARVTVAAGVDRAVPADVTLPVFTSFDEVEGSFDCIIDFSHHSLTGELTRFAVSHSIPLVVATTGQTEEERRMIGEAALSVPVFFAANFSIGVALLCSLAKKTAAVLKDAECEIVEIHHDRKLDAPSGTALAVAESIREARPESEIVCGRSGHAKRGSDEIGISSVRIGNVVGTHEVLIGTKYETITLKHEAHDRALFAEGALAAAEFLAGKAPGLYSMKDLIEL